MIATVQQIAVTTLSPLHIGAGGPPLFDGLDYVSAERIYVIDQERMLDGLSSERLERALTAPRLRDLLNAAEWAGYARYSLPNPTGGQVPQLLRQTKDAFGRPYLPGSTLKGAIRTALAWRLLRDGDTPVRERDLRENARFADDQIMGGLLGGNPYRDLFRAMQVADSAPIGAGPPITAGAGLDLLRVVLYSLRGKQLLPKAGEDWAFFVEAVRPGQELRLSVRLDEYLFQPDVAARIPFELGREALAGWLHHCHAFSSALIAEEQNFYAVYGPAEIAAFYDDLAEQARAITPGREALLQLAWGAGWQSKTVGTHLAQEELDLVRGMFRLGRREVNEFPKSRRLAERGGRPSAPLGWVRLRLLGDAPPEPAPPSVAPARTAPPQPDRAPPPARPAPAGAAPRTLADLRPGQILEGTVKRITDFGAFVDVGVGRDGLLHISQIAERRVASVAEVLTVGQRVRVKVKDVDLAQRKLGLTMRGVDTK